MLVIAYGNPMEIFTDMFENHPSWGLSSVALNHLWHSTILFYFPAIWAFSNSEWQIY